MRLKGIILIAMLISCSACMYVMPGMKPRAYSLYDKQMASSFQPAVVSPRGGLVIQAIDGKTIQPDFFSGLREEQFYLKPGFHVINSAAELPTESATDVGVHEVTQFVALPVFLEPGSYYSLRYNKRTAAAGMVWLEESKTKMFVTGFREEVSGSIAQPPFVIKTWHGACEENGCRHSYIERECAAPTVCRTLQQSCQQFSGCSQTEPLDTPAN